jgi:hypothetical protein
MHNRPPKWLLAQEGITTRQWRARKRLEALRVAVMSTLSRTLATVVLVLLSTGAVAQTASPQKLAEWAAWKHWGDCASPYGFRFVHAMDEAAILYPRFGIAWAEQRNDTAAAVARGENTEAVRKAFIDRMLRTAEPEAVEFYNQMRVLMEQGIASCGPTPARVAP